VNQNRKKGVDRRSDGASRRLKEEPNWDLGQCPCSLSHREERKPGPRATSSKLRKGMDEATPASEGLGWEDPWVALLRGKGGIC